MKYEVKKPKLYVYRKYYFLKKNLCYSYLNIIVNITIWCSIKYVILALVKYNEIL